jgi:FkbM family methyltransferase
MNPFPQDPLPIITQAVIGLARRWPVARGRNRLKALVASTLRERKPYVIARLASSRLRITVPWNDSVGSSLLTFGDNEPDLLRFLSVCLTLGGSTHDCCIDVGANCGAFSLRVAERFRSGKVISFEPNPAVAALLRHNAEQAGLASQIDVREVALGAVDQSMTLSVAPGDSGGGSIRGTEDSGVQVQQRRLSSELSVQEWQRVGVLKVDVEGYELSVFQGAAELLQQYRPPIVFEVNRSELAAHHTKERDLGDFLRQAGYTDFYALGKSLYPIQNGVHAVSNVVALGPDSRQLVEAYGFDANFRPKAERLWPVVHFEF